MNKNCIGKVLIVLIVAIPLIGKAHSGAPHSINFDHEISVVQDRSLVHAAPIQSVSQYTPPAPYNNITFTITAPVKVCVGQTFTIDYAITVSKFTYISYWSDLIPDASQGVPVKVLDVQHPTIGIFNTDDPSIAQKGGHGLWVFPKGLPGSTVQHLKITVQATAAGLLKFATIAATNPPFYLGTAGTLVSCDPPVASPIQVVGLSGRPLEIPILDYIVADSALKVTSVSRANYGVTQLNEDYTVTYTPFQGFCGNDSLSYTVTDAAGNTINGMVAIAVEQSPIPQIIQ